MVLVYRTLYKCDYTEEFKTEKMVNNLGKDFEDEFNILCNKFVLTKEEKKYVREIKLSSALNKLGLQRFHLEFRK